MLSAPSCWETSLALRRPPRRSTRPRRPLLGPRRSLRWRPLRRRPIRSRRPIRPRRAPRGRQLGQGATASEGAQARPKEPEAHVHAQEGLAPHHRQDGGRRLQGSEAAAQLPLRDRQDPAAPDHGQHGQATARGRARREARAPPRAAALPAQHGLIRSERIGGEHAMPVRATTRAILGACGLGAAVSAHGATFTVSNTSDTGAGSLRQAVADANDSADASNTIVFTVPANSTIMLASALENVTSKTL